MKASPLCVLLLVSGWALGAEHAEVALWAKGAPGSEGKTAKEVGEAPNANHGYFKITSVHNPSITVFLPPRESATARRW